MLKRFLLGRYGHSLIFGLFLAISSFLYHQTLSFYFLQDDFVWLSKAANVWTSPRLIFQSDISGFFMPLITVYFTLMHWLVGSISWPYHAANILLHALNGFLLFIFVSRLTHYKKLAFLTAVFFLTARFPLEAVAWISAVTELFSLLLLLGIGLCWLAYLKGLRLRYLIGALLLSIAFLFTKEWACLVIPFLGWITLWVSQTSKKYFTRRFLLVSFAPFFVLFFTYFIFEAILQYHHSPLITQGHYAFGWHALPTILTNITLTFIPLTNTATSFPSIFLMGSAFFVGVIILLGCYQWKKQRGTSILLALAWIMLAFIPTAFFTWDPYVSRYGYIPAIGTSLVLASIFFFLKKEAPASLRYLLNGFLIFYLFFNIFFIFRTINGYYAPMNTRIVQFSEALRTTFLLDSASLIGMYPFTPHQPAVLPHVFWVEKGIDPARVKAFNTYTSCPQEMTCFEWNSLTRTFNRHPPLPSPLPSR